MTNDVNIDVLEPFLDDEGRLVAMPVKKVKRSIALSYLASKFESERTYTEKEVNEILKQWHTFEDWALLRRELFNSGLLDRNLDGTDYKVGQDNS